MSYNIIAVPTFKKQLKRLSKKYPSIKKNLTDLFEALETQPTLGISLGHNCYKIRVAITSKGKGKSGGARVITNFAIKDATIYLLSIYDKSEIDNLDDNELDDLLKNIPL